MAQNPPAREGFFMNTEQGIRRGGRTLKEEGMSDLRISIFDRMDD